MRVPHIPQLKEHNIRSGFFEHEDFLALRGALPDYAQVAASLAYYSGMRMGEICSLQWRQVDWTEGKLYLQAKAGGFKFQVQRVNNGAGAHRLPGAWLINERGI